MEILQSPSFARTVKKLKPNQKKSLDKAIKEISANPAIGEAKVGDLEGICVFKFNSGTLKFVLAYRVISKNQIKLLVIGPHENFYRNAKRGEKL